MKNLYKAIIAATVSFLLPLISSGQQDILFEQDSVVSGLLLEIEKNSSPLEKMKRYELIVNRAEYIAIDQCKKYVDLAGKLSRTTNDEELNARYYRLKGLYLKNFGNQTEALDTLKLAKNLLEKSDLHILKGKVISLIARINIDTGKKEIARKQLLDAIIDYQDKSEQVLSYLFIELANTYYEDEMYDDAEKYYLKAVELCQENNLEEYINTKVMLVRLYINIGKYNEAFEITYEAITHFEKEGDLTGVSEMYGYLAVLHVNYRNEKEAFECGRKFLAGAEQVNDTELIIESNNLIGRLYTEFNNFEKALTYYDTALTKAESIKEFNIIPYYSILLDKSYLYLNEEDWEKALNLLEEGYQNMSNINIVLYREYEQNYAMALIYSGQEEKGIKIMEDFVEYATEENLVDLLADANEVLSIGYAATGDYRKAYRSEIAAKNYSEQLKSEEKLMEAADIKAQAELEKEREILAAQKAKDEAVLKAETQQSRIIAGAIGLLALLGFGFFWNARRQNKTIAEQNEQLNHLNQTKDRIFAILGHDMRKPVLSFRGIAEKVNYLLQNKDYERLGKLGNQIEENALGLSKLTDNLLNWALTQRDVMPYNPETIQLAMLTEEVKSIFTGISQSKNINIILDIPENLKVYADKNALMTIIRNLLDNALKYTPSGGEVHLIATSNPAGVNLKVKDTGIGISPEKTKEIFLLSQNKSEVGTKGEKGTGLGLHLVNELVKLNKGRIQVKSILGKGTAFELSLPTA